MKMKLKSENLKKSLENHDLKELKIILVDNSISIEKLNQIQNIKSYLIIVFDYESKKKLDENNIEHITSDEFLNKNDLNQIQNEIYNLSKWFEQPEIRNHIIFEDVNVGRLFHEQFSEFLVKFLKKYREIYNIHTMYQNSFYLASEKTYEIIHLLTESTEKIQDNVKKTTFVSDKVRVNLKIGKHHFMFFLSRNFYLNLKKNSEKIINLFFSPRKVSGKTTLLVEIHTIRYKKLLTKAKNQSFNLFFYGRRRPAIWNLETYNIFKKSGCKVITSYALIDKKFSNVVQKNTEELTNKIKKLWKNDEFFYKFFSKESVSSWNIIQSDLVQLIESRLNEIVYEIELVKNLFNKYNFSSIVVFHEVGLTEQIVISRAKKLGIPIILLQQGLYFDTSKAKLANQSMTVYPRDADKFVVWGNVTKQDVIKNINFPESKIEVIGSPRYDDISIEGEFSQDYVLLAAQGPSYPYVQGHQIKNFENYEKIISKICKIVLNNNKKLIIKLHPSSWEFDITKLVKKINPKIQVVTRGDIIPLIRSCSVMISVGLSTSILEAQILKKPVIVIPIVDYDMGIPEIYKTDSCLVCNPENFEGELSGILSSEEIKLEVIQKGNYFLKKYLVNPKKASEQFFELLKTL